HFFPTRRSSDLSRPIAKHLPALYARVYSRSISESETGKSISSIWSPKSVTSLSFLMHLLHGFRLARIPRHRPRPPQRRFTGRPTGSNEHLVVSQPRHVPLASSQLAPGFF